MRAVDPDVDRVAIGLARAALPVPMLPLAPLTFSMIMGCPSEPLIRSAASRLIVSEAAPAGDGTIMVIGGDG
jgi:hypothetical protein